MFELRQLRLISMLAQEGTAVAAAAKLGFSPAAVSQQLAAMSKVAGQSLTRKEGRRLVLTATGERVALHAEEILAAVGLMEAEIATESHAAPRLRIATFPSGAKRFVIPAVIEFKAAAPATEVQIVEAEPDSAIPMLKQGVVDVAVAYTYSLQPRQADPGLSVMALADQPMSFVCDDVIASRLRGGLTQARTLLQDLPWVAGPVNADDREVLRRMCAGIGFEPRIVHSMDDYALTLSLVAAGLGVALVPLAAVSSIPQGVRVLPVAGAAPVRHVWAATQRGHSRRTAVAALLASLKSAAEETTSN